MSTNIFEYQSCIFNNWIILTFEDPVFSESLAFTESNNILYDLFYTPVRVFLVLISTFVTLWLIQNFFLKILVRKYFKIQIGNLMDNFSTRQKIFLTKIYLKCMIPLPGSQYLYDLSSSIKNTFYYNRWIIKNKYIGLYAAFTGKLVIDYKAF